MMWWPGVLVVVVALIVFGWWGHGWWCMRRNGCPIWRQIDTGEWVRKLTDKGWLTKNGNRHFPREDRERHPTTEIVTPRVLDEMKKSGDPWAEWRQAPPLDEGPKTGIPLQIKDTPTTGVANPKRRVP